MRTSPHNHQSGFTLLEIVVVFSLIALFSTYMIGSVVITSQRRARDTNRKADLAGIGKTMEMYFNDYNRYPASNASGQIVACGTNGDQPCTWGQAWTGANNTTYMNPLPADRRNGFSYHFRSSNLGWQVYARLEIEDDPLVQTYSYNCGVLACNYGIAGGNTQPGQALP